MSPSVGNCLELSVMSAQIATGCDGICHLLHVAVSRNCSPFPCLTFDHLSLVLLTKTSGRNGRHNFSALLAICMFRRAQRARPIPKRRYSPHIKSTTLGMWCWERASNFSFSLTECGNYACPAVSGRNVQHFYELFMGWFPFCFTFKLLFVCEYRMGSHFWFTNRHHYCLMDLFWLRTGQIAFMG